MDDSNVVFLDIDGVLNDCTAIGVLHENAIDILCIAVLNELLKRTDSKIVIISTWKDSYDIEDRKSDV